MVMKPASVTPFVMAQAEFPFEFLVIAFDTPTRLDGFDQRREGLVFSPPNAGACAHAQRVDQFLLGQPVAQGRVVDDPRRGPRA